MGRDVRIRIAFGATIADPVETWLWTDVTSYWHVPHDVQVTWGTSSSASKVETATLGLSLKNPDARFTPFDGRSPYWPHVIEWTPIEYAIDLGDGTGWRVRFSGFVRNWAVEWPGASALMAVTRVQAVGILGRLERGRPPQRSAMRRATVASSPGAYWPCEDGGDATQAASAIPGHPPIGVSGVVEFAGLSIETAGGNAAIGSLPLPDLSAGGRLVASIPADVTAACTAAGQYAIGFMAEVEVSSHAGELALIEWQTPAGSFVRWRLVFFTAGTVLNWNLRAYNASGAATHVNGGAGHSFGAWRITAAQSGGNITLTLYFGSNFAITSTVAGTLAGPTQIVANPDGITATAPVPMGHLTVWPTATPSLPMWRDITDPYGRLIRAPDILPWEGEAAHLRLDRLCAEEGLAFTPPVLPVDDITRMGPQPAGTFAELAGQCAESDQGLLYEDGFGFAFLPRVALYNAPVTLTIDAAAGQLGGDLAPTAEDPNRRNLWTVSREGGSSGTARDEALIAMQGEIEGTTTVHHLDDSLLGAHAAWWLRRNSVQDLRYPTLSIDLYAHRELAAVWCDVRPGARVQVVNPPAQAPGVIDQIVMGASETYRGRRGWRVTLNVQPAAPWQVAEVDGDQRVPADGSTLAADLAEAGTVWAVANTAGNGPWTADPTDYPLDVRVGGERIRADAPGSVVNPNPWFVADVAGYAGAASSISWTASGRPDTPHGAARITPDGVSAVGQMTSTPVAVNASTSYRLTMWAHADVAAVQVSIAADWQTGAGVPISSSFGTPVTLTPGVWTPLIVTFTSPATAGQVVMRARHQGTPAATSTWRVAGFTLAPESTVTGSGAFQRLSSAPDGRGLNGFTRSWPAGTQVDVWAPAIAPL
ncbi:hypothetical protein ABZ793_06220 [Micromonospora sp. NPDC047465]|uniref:hypothetical protein n=1 Tax=Micromonospora sp. NPDC047465 TaxID=3154813 RepID=UPI0033F988A1